MSARFNATDVAFARRLRALEDANDATIQASANLIATMVDARQARGLPKKVGHDILARLGGLMADAIQLQGKSLTAHEDVASLGASLGLPVTAFGDACQDYIVSPNTTGLAAIERAA